jgi:hypothetical protein
VSSPNYSIEATGLNRTIIDCLVAAERCVTFQALHKISNTTITSISNAIKAARPGWGAGGVYANTHGLISAA